MLELRTYLPPMVIRIAGILTLCAFAHSCDDPFACTKWRDEHIVRDSAIHIHGLTNDTIHQYDTLELEISFLQADKFRNLTFSEWIPFRPYFTADFFLGNDWTVYEGALDSSLGVQLKFDPQLDQYRFRAEMVPVRLGKYEFSMVWDSRLVENPHCKGKSRIAVVKLNKQFVHATDSTQSSAWFYVIE